MSEERERISRGLIRLAASAAVDRYFWAQARYSDSWRDMGISALLNRLEGEIQEFRDACEVGDETDVINEARDVATMALIVAAKAKLDMDGDRL